ncbi:NUDIX hydrolase [Alterileibacterium massiliense]|uniref:NUDIX hydrolase n=1 Tax=Alterileibacterium massiliense TaxID=1870997 RepID=UPI0008D9A4CA|nr:8-oxo-dGTP diphosphatase [Alterileibacterium massiliense]
MYKLSTLCYIKRDDSILMLHRVKKKNDINKGKWIGVGGHFEDGESPEECLIREVLEETGLKLTSYKFRAIITFIYDKDITEYMHLYTADEFFGEMIECDEGNLSWVPKSKLLDLELWDGDKIFLKLLDERDDFFSLKLIYDKNDNLVEAVLDGNRIK